uniref:Pre-mRNA-processing factor 19 n=1 Tax=Albugo laibachii Nc14 TaxID=890382 RepID=F0W682_9STRA|nr:premRNAprocessing factor 19 putative [Albugo laibachii Nc14]|eukprot:CCA16624.1 premRNAprocessing factor 19 putative [Albugo laibachii Nc14]
MLCAISGLLPTEPVVSVKSGHVFEKRLLFKHLELNQNRCPVTNEELDIAHDIVSIQTCTNLKSSTLNPTPAVSNDILNPTSIPTLLQTFQNEWDAVMLETFTLRQHLEKTRQELSHALYQHDAACRVIARLNAENAELRSTMETLSRSSVNGTTESTKDVPMESVGDPQVASLSEVLLNKVDGTQKTLAKERKEFKKKIAPERAEKLQNLATDWKVTSSHTWHESEKPGVLSLAINASCTKIASGGVDKRVQIFDMTTQQVVGTLQGHQKKISHILFHPTASLLISSSYDKDIKTWSLDNNKVQTDSLQTLRGHQDAVTMTSLHATGDYLLSSSLDGNWAFYDLHRGQRLVQQPLDNSNERSEKALCIEFHPDGGIFGIGSSSSGLQMWDVKSCSNVVTFEDHAAPVTAISFSENGYHLMSGSSNGIVHLWDLRKLKTIYSIDIKSTENAKSPGNIQALSFDPSGTFVALASGAQVLIAKELNKSEWSVVKSFDDHKANVMAAEFASDSSFLASASMDRSVKIFKQP